MLSVFLLSFETNTKESIFSCEMFLKAEDGVVYSSPPDRPDIEKKSKLAPHFRLEIGSCPTRSRDYPCGRCAVTKISYPALAVILGTLTILAQVASCYLVAHKPRLCIAAQAMVMLGGAGNRFGEYLFMNCANLPDLLVAVNLPIENSLDLLPTFGSLASSLEPLKFYCALAALSLS